MNKFHRWVSKNYDANAWFRLLVLFVTVGINALGTLLIFQLGLHEWLHIGLSVAWMLGVTFYATHACNTRY